MEPYGQEGEESRRPDRGGPGQIAVNMNYVPTEDEKRVLRECSRESLWYRALPISALSMLVTQVLIKKGILTTSTRYGPFPKLAFACGCGYFIGKISYMRECQEKLKKLENSPLAESLRQRRPISPEYHSKIQFSNVPSSSPFETSPAEAPPSSVYSGSNRGMESSGSDYEPIPFSSSMNESSPTGITDSVPQEPGPSIEASPKKKAITYEELRSRNRELYEVGIPQKPELLSKSSPERLSKKEVKVNKYGDAWEE